MKKSIKTYLFLSTVLGVLGSIAIGVVSTLVLPNWDSHAEIELFFPKNASEKISSYYEVNCDSLRLCQTEGDSGCRYTVQCQPRGGKYETVVPKITFSENDEWGGETYTLESYFWRDIRFKVLKTENQGVKSEILLSLGKSND